MFEEVPGESFVLESDCRIISREELLGGDSYELLEKKENANVEEVFKQVIGHESQKKELLVVLDWFKRSKKLKEKGISIPRGVILFGEPGNGKSLLIKCVIECCEAPVLIFRGNNENIPGGIIETFNKAKELGHALIVIDEIDLLINKDARTIRALQECLDGVESNDDVLVLTATNDIEMIPAPLLRSGRLEKIMKIPFPTGKEAVDIFKKYFKDLNLKMPDDIDEDELALSLSTISCVDIKTIVNDIALRNDNEDITEEMIDESVYNVTKRVKDSPKEDNIQVAIHEAGHAIVARAYKSFFVVDKLSISGAGGSFVSKEIEEGFWNYEKSIAYIKICMGGILAEKILCGMGSIGCLTDLESARRMAYNLYNVSGYSSCWETLPEVSSDSRTETSIKRRRMERKIEKLLRKCEKETKRYIQNHKKEIHSLGKLLFEKKNLKSKEIISCIENTK